MTRFALTLVFGLLLSFGTVVTGGFFSQARAGNWNVKDGQHSGIPEIVLKHIPSTSGVLGNSYDHSTSDFSTLAQRLGHWSWCVSFCQLELNFDVQKIENYKTRFYNNASKKDKALFRKRREFGPETYFDIRFKTGCEMALVTDFFYIMDKTIFWLDNTVIDGAKPVAIYIRD